MPDGTEQRFGVGMSAPVRRRACGLQLGPYVEVVVDLTVERDREAAAVAVHRLAACLRQIENGEPPMAEGNPRRRTGPVTLRIRSAIGQRVRHRFRDGRKLSPLAPAGPKQARNAAHQSALPIALEPTASSFSCN